MKVLCCALLLAAHLWPAVVAEEMGEVASPLDRQDNQKIPVPTDQEMTYHGCFIDNIDGQRNYEVLLDDSDDNTPQSCLERCYAAGYLFSAVQYSKQCFCSNDLYPKDLKAEESSCNMRCSGDDQIVCGGTDRNSVYSFEEIKTYYYGCYRDNQENRFLEVMLWAGNDDNTPKKCVDACNANGYQLAGVQYYGECFCGNDEYPEEQIDDETNCNTPCNGNNNLMCGGTLRNSVYSYIPKKDHLHALSQGKPLNYHGCFVDYLTEFEINLGFFDGMTPLMCHQKCQAADKTYAAIQFSKECHCSDMPYPETERVSESECSMPCPGDVYTKCGGAYRISVYSLEDMYLSNIHFHGCFMDSDGPDLTVDKVFTYLGTYTDNTPLSCLERCKQDSDDYAYAAVQRSEECFCSSVPYPASEMVEEAECNMPCTGDATVMCGGSWKNSVYSYGNGNI